MKNKIEHTPGPWKMVLEKGTGKLCAYCGTGNYARYVIKGPSVTGLTENTRICELPAEANARLIAAAPDMYKFIRDVVDVIENATSKSDRRTIADAARAAIAKAKGGA